MTKYRHINKVYVGYFPSDVKIESNDVLELVKHSGFPLSAPYIFLCNPPHLVQKGFECLLIFPEEDLRRSSSIKWQPLRKVKTSPMEQYLNMVEANGATRDKKIDTIIFASENWPIRAELEKYLDTEQTPITSIDIIVRRIGKGVDSQLWFRAT